jgi:hypothetical protein
MEIQSLKLMVTENELNRLAAELLPKVERIRDLYVKVVPEGVAISGSYQSFIALRFETLWEVFVHEGKIGARLTTVKTAGLPMSLLRGYLTRVIASATTLIEVEGETLLFDLDLLLAAKGLPLRTNLTALRLSYGSLVIESGKAAA